MSITPASGTAVLAAAAAEEEEEKGKEEDLMHAGEGEPTTTWAPNIVKMEVDVYYDDDQDGLIPIPAPLELKSWLYRYRVAGAWWSFSGISLWLFFPATWTAISSFYFILLFNIFTSKLLDYIFARWNLWKFGQATRQDCVRVWRTSGRRDDIEDHRDEHEYDDEEEEEEEQQEMEMEIPASQLKRGDQIQLEKGQWVHADLKLLSREKITLDLTALFLPNQPYRSLPPKNPRHRTRPPVGRENEEDNDDDDDDEYKDWIWAGSKVLFGSGRAIVMRTGPRTRLGQEGLQRPHPQFLQNSNSSLK